MIGVTTRIVINDLFPDKIKLIALTFKQIFQRGSVATWLCSSRDRIAHGHDSDRWRLAGEELSNKLTIA
ncbi:hypothetical protein WH5701_09705 [Synechococcus sp. WH 5701]|nr:hypothetical protein WH5701_09705 [Synechococcus sp. WH 5701]